MLLKKNAIQQVSNDVMNMLHEEEIEIINSFHDAALAKDVAKINELFPVVEFDVEDHFTTEEDMMEQSQFYGMQMHKSEHDSLRKKLKTLKEHWAAHTDPQEIQRFLEEEFKHWMELHVARWDAETAMHIGDTN
ncbi:MAG: hemerythrin family protein [Campylobacterota bacterium]|nr:hemerythrin family protein [Campylobacterota bacterium]